MAVAAGHGEHEIRLAARADPRASGLEPGRERQGRPGARAGRSVRPSIDREGGRDAAHARWVGRPVRRATVRGVRGQGGGGRVRATGRRIDERRTRAVRKRDDESRERQLRVVIERRHETTGPRVGVDPSRKLQDDARPLHVQVDREQRSERIVGLRCEEHRPSEGFLEHRRLDLHRADLRRVGARRRRVRVKRDLVRRARAQAIGRRWRDGDALGQGDHGSIEVRAGEPVGIVVLRHLDLDGVAARRVRRGRRRPHRYARLERHVLAPGGRRRDRRVRPVPPGLLVGVHLQRRDGRSLAGRRVLHERPTGCAGPVVGGNAPQRELESHRVVRVGDPERPRQQAVIFRVPQPDHDMDGGIELPDAGRVDGDTEPGGLVRRRVKVEHLQRTRNGRSRRFVVRVEEPLAHLGLGRTADDLRLEQPWVASRNGERVADESRRQLEDEVSQDPRGRPLRVVGEPVELDLRSRVGIGARLGGARVRLELRDPEPDRSVSHGGSDDQPDAGDRR